MLLQVPATATCARQAGRGWPGCCRWLRVREPVGMDKTSNITWPNWPPTTSGFPVVIPSTQGPGHPARAGALHREPGRPGPRQSCYFHTAQTRLARVPPSSRQWHRERKSSCVPAKPPQLSAASRERYSFLLFWAESCPSMSWMLSTQRLGCILYVLRLPFPSDLRVDCFFFFLSVGVLKVTFWFTFRVAI